MTEPEYGEITRGDLMAALPATARIQLVSTTAEAARALADGGTVSRVYQNSLTEYAPRGCSLHRHRHGDSGWSGCGVHGPARLRRCLWSVRMNINDLTANFTTEFVLPEARSTGSGDAAKGLTAASGRLFFLLAAKERTKENCRCFDAADPRLRGCTPLRTPVEVGSLGG
ncbi:hypothetical protein NIA69_21885 [Gemmiger formicilis]|nr:hypothetical protein [Gemmiger formicilis]